MARERPRLSHLREDARHRTGDATAPHEGSRRAPVNRTCAGCGTQFYDPKARLRYCEDRDPETGEHNGNWHGATEEAICRLRGSAFESCPSDKEGVFCPACVEARDEFPGTPSWTLREVERVAFERDQCGEPFELLASAVERLEDRGRFCSHDCRSARMSENWRTADHPAWKGGGTIPYAGRWWEAGRLALERDEYSCRSCGRTRAETRRDPDVHHITPVRDFDDPQDAHYPDNLVRLCRSCHPKVEAGLLPVPDVE